MCLDYNADDQNLRMWCLSFMEGTKILRAVHPLWLCNWSTAKRAAGDCRWAPLAQDVPTRSHNSIHFVSKADTTHPCCFSSLGLLACSLWFFLTMTKKMTKSVWWEKEKNKITPLFANSSMQQWVSSPACYWLCLIAITGETGVNDNEKEI